MQFNLFAFIAAAAIGVLGAPATTTVSTGTVTSRVPTGTPITSRVSTGTVTSRVPTGAPITSRVSTGTVTSRVSTIGSSPSSAFPPAPTPWIIVYPYCEALRVQCKKNEGTYFNKLNCVMMIACTHPFLSVQYAIDHVLWTGEGPAPKGYNLPRLSVNIFNQHSSDGKVWTQQNFIDTFYGALSAAGGPYPESADAVIAMWNAISAWTGFCDTREIPYQNLADFFQWSGTKGAPTNCP